MPNDVEVISIRDRVFRRGDLITTSSETVAVTLTNCTFHSLWESINDEDCIYTFDRCCIRLEASKVDRCFLQMNFKTCKVEFDDVDNGRINISTIRCEGLDFPHELFSSRLIIDHLHLLGLKKMPDPKQTLRVKICKSFQLEACNVRTNVMEKLALHCEKISLTRCDVDSYHWLAQRSKKLKIAIRKKGATSLGILEDEVNRIRMNLQERLATVSTPRTFEVEIRVYNAHLQVFSKLILLASE